MKPLMPDKELKSRVIRLRGEGKITEAEAARLMQPRTPSQEGQRRERVRQHQMVTHGKVLVSGRSI